jgi:hypothetical protein
MDALLIKPKNKTELQFVSEFLKRMRIEAKALSDDEKEDLGLVKLMKQVDRTEKISKEKVIAKLQKK